MIVEFVKSYLSELISMLAVILAVVAGSRAVKANKLAERTAAELKREQHAARRKEIVLSTERQIAISKKMKLLLQQKYRYICENKIASKLFPNEKERIKNCLEVIEDQNESIECKYKLLESDSIGSNAESANDILSGIERLAIRMYADYENEQAEFELLKGRVKENS